MPGAPPLHHAIEAKSSKVMKVLLDHGADPETRYARRSAGHLGMPTDRNIIYQQVEAGVEVRVSYSVSGFQWVLTSKDGLVEANTPPYPAVMTTVSKEALKQGIEISRLAQ